MANDLTSLASGILASPVPGDPGDPVAARSAGDRERRGVPRRFGSGGAGRALSSGANLKILLLMAAAGLGVLALSACAAGPNPALDSGPDPAGFWLGLWHGFISPFSFIVSLFTDDVSIYETQNSGNWYDAGFMIGISTVFGGGGGGGAAASRRR